MHVGLVSPERETVFGILQKETSIAGYPVEVHEIEGHRNFKSLSPQDTWKKYRESYFCPVLKGDLPYQKRFFDVVLSGCLPVVLSHESRDDNPHASWFEKGGFGYDITHPFSSIINYTDFVVEVDNVDNLVSTLEQLLQDKDKIRRMQTAMGKVAPKFVYGLGEDFNVPGDAFDEVLGQLEEYLAQFQQ